LREKGRDTEVSGWPLLKNEKTSIHWLAESTRSGSSASGASMRTEMNSKSASRVE